MKVKDLIEQLKRYDQEKHVVIVLEDEFRTPKVNELDVEEDGMHVITIS